MEIKDLNFLKIAIEKHPKTKINLEYLIKQNAIAALILNKSGNQALLVKQYRPGAAKDLYEIPAGLIDPGEDAIDTLKREILEETGYEEKDYDIILSYPVPLFVSPGYTQEQLFLYIVKLKEENITPKPLTLDSGEDLTNHWFNIDEVEKISLDMKTIFSVYIYKNLKNNI